MMSSTALLILLSALLVCLGRTLVPGHGLSLAGTYEAFVHIWVGALLAVVWYEWRKPAGWTAVAALAVATLFEVGMFLAR